VVAPTRDRWSAILGTEIGDFIRNLHEKTHRVIFHLKTKTTAITADGRRAGKPASSIPADLVVVGVGVRPACSLQSSRHGSQTWLVNEYLETSVPGIYAAGDIARYPDTTQRRTRAHRTLGGGAMARPNRRATTCSPATKSIKAVPFFWSAHYDVTLNYVGHAEHWDRIEINGSIEDQACTLH